MKIISRLESRPCEPLVALKAAPGSDGWGFTLLAGSESGDLFMKKARLRLGQAEVYEAEYYTATDSETSKVPAPTPTG